MTRLPVLLFRIPRTLVHLPNLEPAYPELFPNARLLCQLVWFVGSRPAAPSCWPGRLGTFADRWPTRFPIQLRLIDDS